MTAMAFQCSHRMGLDSFQEPSACDLGKMQIGTVYVLKKEKRSNVKWVFVSGAGSIQLELRSINGLETTAVCF